MDPFITFLLLVVIVWAVSFRRRRTLRAPLPPGPPADPILGHLRHIPSENPEFRFTEWAKTYGDVVYLHILSRPIIVLNTVEAAIDLLEKRGWNYSDRPNFPILNLMGWGDAMVFLRYGKAFQKQQRLIKDYFNRKKVEEYKSLQISQARQLALALAQGKEDRESILQKFGTSIIVRIAFGHDMYSENDTNFNEIVRDNNYAATHCGPPGGTLVDLFPIFQHLPSWFPGTFFANQARKFYPVVQKLHDYPFTKVQQQMLEGSANPCFLSYHLERLQQDNKDESQPDYKDLKEAASAIFGAGADTIWATLSVFILAMVLHPECQDKAQEELDNLLLGSRLPEFEDRNALPYVECIVQETYRWLSVTPLGVPHRTLHDDVYKGMFIPKGARVFANSWGISRDEALYHDSDSFNPSRYQPKAEGGNEERFPAFQFGFGRRMCPGRYLGDGNFWISAATILSIFRIERAKDANGEEIIPSIGMHTGVTSHPEPYECDIRVRNEKAKVLLQEYEGEVTKTGDS